MMLCQVVVALVVVVLAVGLSQERIIGGEIALEDEEVSGSIVTKEMRTAETVRELHEGVVFLNVPLNVASVNSWLDPPLEADVFEDKAWVSVQLDEITKLDLNLLGMGFVPTPLTGYQYKVNVLVRDRQTGGKGYLIVNIDFADDLVGIVKSLGARVTQGVPSKPVHFEVVQDNSTVEWKISDTHDGDQMFRLKAKLGSPVNMTRNDQVSEFVRFVSHRYFKYLQSPSGKVEYAMMLPSLADLSARKMKSYRDSETRLLHETETDGDLLGSFLGVKHRIVCPTNRCFWQSRILFVDRENIYAGG